MGILKGIIRRGINKGVNDAVGNTVSNAVAGTLNNALRGLTGQTRESENATRNELERNLNGLNSFARAATASRCPSCGGSVNADVKFCPSCGAAQPSRETAAASCPYCGAEITSDAKFCPGCGAKTNAAARASTPVQRGSSGAMRAYFDGLIRSEFASYDIASNVSPATLGGTGKSYDYALYLGGRVAGVIMITDHNRDGSAAFKNAKRTCESAGVPFINFYTHMPNERGYVVSRIRNMLA